MSHLVESDDGDSLSKGGRNTGTYADRVKAKPRNVATESARPKRKPRQPSSLGNK